MSADLFVGREDERSAVRTLVDHACGGRGGFLIIDGPPGIGKTALLRQVQQAGGPAEFLSVECHLQVGQLEAYGPLIDLVLLIEQNRPRKTRLWRRSSDAVKQRWPELLTLVPGVGSTLKMVAETLSGPVPGAPLVENHTAARAMAEALLRIVKERHPLVISIDDFHRIDESSCSVLSYVARAIEDQPVLIVLVGCSDELRANPAARRLTEDLLGKGLARRMQLRGLPESAVAEYAARMSADVTAAELAQRTGGHPLLLRYSLARRKGLALPPGPGGPVMAHPDDARLAEQVRQMVTAQLSRLSYEDRRLLAVGAVEGRTFHSSVVARVLDEQRDRVADRLHRLASDTGLLHVLQSDRWDDWLGADRYAFEHDLVQEALYSDQSERQRRDRHRRIGHIMHEHSQDYRDLTQGVALELVRHHRLGHDWLAAGRVAHFVACRLSQTGASAPEVIKVAQDGLESIRQAPAGEEASRIRAQLIELLLTASELSWRTKPESDGTVRLEALASEAVSAAEGSGDVNLRIRARYLSGKVLLYTRGVPTAIPPLQQAWQEALDTGDPVSILLAGCEYGRQLPKIDVEGGLAVLAHAEATASDHEAVRQSEDPVVQRARHMVALQIGVNLYDAGRLGAALTRLRATIEQVRRRPNLGLLPIGLNYLAQAEAGVGNYAESEQCLVEALGYRDEEEPDGWHAVNLAYLGARRVHDHQDASGLEHLRNAQAEAAVTWQANLAPLVANLYAECLMAMAGVDPAHDTLAGEMLRTCLEETQRTGMRRSEIVTLSLLGQWHLDHGDAQQALQFSGRAVEHLREAGWRLAAVTAEEVLFRRAAVQHALGDIGAAERSVSLARSLVLDKAAALGGQLRDRFLHCVPINRSILEAGDRQQQEGVHGHRKEGHTDPAVGDEPQQGDG
ncbi:Predicted ATPase [Micromonospora sediminicola]|uniref:Predicted ATPase n=1 Tax=Micromonospora sediminicola TaxID=946078 RepID=A0A1A9B9M5_9ACTN|nr:AAA family ATPase [Micromonospora sediminicola]SBT65674.1 Predicted ATPase [Micromonospora sediminicola]